MSVVAKILIVLNLILAVVFLGSAATFLGAKETWKKQYDDLKVKTDGDIATLTTQRDKLQGDLRNTEISLGQLTNQLTDVEGKYKAKETDYAEIIKRRDELAAEMTKLTAIKEDLVKQIAGLTQRKDELVEEKDRMATDKRQAIDAENAAVTEQRRLHDQLNDANDMIVELQKRIKGLSDQIETQKMSLLVYEDKFGPIGDVIIAPPLKAKVSAVNNELNIVVLSIGRDDKVKAGYEFTVYRGAEYVGRIVIDKVDKDFCSGYSRKELEKNPIAVGDDARTRY